MERTTKLTKQELIDLLVCGNCGRGNLLIDGRLNGFVGVVCPDCAHICRNCRKDVSGSAWDYCSSRCAHFFDPATADAMDEEQKKEEERRKLFREHMAEMRAKRKKRREELKAARK